MSAIITVEHLVKRYKKEKVNAVDDISFHRHFPFYSWGTKSIRSEPLANGFIVSIYGIVGLTRHSNSVLMKV